MLELQNLSVSYGAIDAVKSVSLTAQRGVITALIGANGAGKSSLLKSISGLVAPEQGKVMLDGNDLAKIGPHERARLGIAHALEGRRIFHQHTVEENLITAWHFRKPKGNFKAAQEQVYSNFPILHERRRAKAGTLSGGQQQMLILSMATLHKPTLVLLDEPSLGLAPIVITQIYDFIRRYAAEGERVVLISEQMATLALKVADYGHVLRQGVLMQSGTAEQLKGAGLTNAYLG
ncbi:ABC transporter ATP-binding protein [Halomonas sp. HAL1]|uniref:ABC transporter ATP-binding protein n=1 Tax=Halomonas sp. HAL1 TaxID=550984 RepID=UPI00022D3391|nr:ABC transporter ATP-binding protein [Halomonas sp. HAL1]EHA16372.1 branched-chain amino acid ABC transporter ATP-binding protein [Halomonas sp. HAL1]WKV94193.1 ABC transporter ATP-binding protein [Halomonas sp. HAL1]